MKEIDITFCKDEAFFETVLNNGRALIWLAGLDKGCYYFNKPWLDFRGRTLEEESGNGWAEGVHPDDFERCLKVYTEAFDKREKFSMVYRLRRHDGIYRFILDDGSPNYNANGEFIGYIGHCFDITEAEQAINLANINASKLQESENRFHTLMDNIVSIAVQGYTLDGNVTFWNHASEKLYGYSKEEAFAGNLLDLIIPKEMQDDVKGAMQWMGQTGKSIPAGELLLQRKDGSYIPVFSSHGLIKPIDSPPELFCLDIDLSEQKKTQKALQESEIRFKALHNASFGGIAIHDKGIILDCNQGLSNLSGYSVDELIGMNGLLLIAEKYRDIVMSNIKIGYDKPYEVFGIRKDGTEFPVRLEGKNIPYRGIEARVVEFRNITEEKKAQDDLRLAASVFTYAREGIVITNPEGVIININDSFSRITGYSAHEVIGKKTNILKSGHHDNAFYDALWHSLKTKGHWYGEVWNRRKNGEIYVEMLTISAIHNDEGNITQYVALFSDITTIKEHEQQLEHIAYHDALTNLPNRILLADRLSQSMASVKRRNKSLALVYLDLDNFKIINDTYGHEVGDQLLVALSTRMRESLREGDTLARLGGDEFAVVVMDIENIESCLVTITRLLEATTQNVIFDDVILKVSASIGVTFYPQEEDVEADQLLRQADQAMYQAKLGGKNCYHLFDAEKDRSTRGRHESLERIRQALKESEFVLYYQPKVNMKTGSLIGVEALIRWNHPQKGLLSPALFLPIIENHPLAVEIGEWVIDTALCQINQWKSTGLTIPISVNISARQLQQIDFVGRLHILLSKYPDISPSLLELEILETSALEDLNGVSKIIKECRSFGVNFALDDFGTGYSSLTYLKQLPVNLLKIDQTFVRDMLQDPDDLAILVGILGLAKSFRRQVIAEGVESIAEGELLLQLGCEMAQGYAIARPMQAEKLPHWLAKWRADKIWKTTRKMNRDDFSLLFAMVEHRSWIGAIENYLGGTSDHLPPTHEHQCKFGIWLNDESISYYGRANLEPIFSVHRDIHILAKELCMLYEKGQKDEVLKRLDELYELRDSLIKKLKALAI